MKCFVVPLLSIVCAFAATLVPLHSAELKVVVWNIEWYPGKDIHPTPEGVAAQKPVVKEAIRKLDPDILIATEIRDFASFQEIVDEVPGLNVHVVSSFVSTDTGTLWPQQVAIASKLPCRAAWAEFFRPTVPSIYRGFSFAALESPDGGGLLMVYGAHLKSNRAWNDDQRLVNYTLREESIAQMLDHMELMTRVTFSESPVRGWIFGGDMNTNDDGQFEDKTISMVEEAGFWNTWKRVDRKDRLTWRGNDKYEATTFDYIFLKGLGEPDAFMFTTPPETSDHEAIGVTLDLESLNS